MSGCTGNEEPLAVASGCYGQRIGGNLHSQFQFEGTLAGYRERFCILLHPLNLDHLMSAIDNMQESDWEQVRSIYLDGIATGDATFETSAPEWARWHADHLAEPRLVYREGKKICGWAALSPVSGRCVYAGVAEVSVYVAQDNRGRGVGRALLSALVDRSEHAGIWTLQAGVFPENHASIELHKKCGFREVGTREKLGQIAGVWRDVVLLERRSKITGID